MKFLAFLLAIATLISVSADNSGDLEFAPYLHPNTCAFVASIPLAGTQKPDYECSYVIPSDQQLLIGPNSYWLLRLICRNADLNNHPRVLMDLNKNEVGIKFRGSAGLIDYTATDDFGLSHDELADKNPEIYQYHFRSSTTRRLLQKSQHTPQSIHVSRVSDLKAIEFLQRNPQCFAKLHPSLSKFNSIIPTSSSRTAPLYPSSYFSDGNIDHLGLVPDKISEIVRPTKKMPEMGKENTSGESSTVPPTKPMPQMGSHGQLPTSSVLNAPKKQMPQMGG